MPDYLFLILGTDSFFFLFFSFFFFFFQCFLRQDFFLNPLLSQFTFSLHIQSQNLEGKKARPPPRPPPAPTPNSAPTPHKIKWSTPYQHMLLHYNMQYNAPSDALKNKSTVENIFNAKMAIFANATSPGKGLNAKMTSSFLYPYSRKCRNDEV